MTTMSGLSRAISHTCYFSYPVSLPRLSIELVLNNTIRENFICEGLGASPYLILIGYYRSKGIIEM